jgi:hypothetical protein
MNTGDFDLRIWLPETTKFGLSLMMVPLCITMSLSMPIKQLLFTAE